MSYKWTSGSVRRGDIYAQDDTTGDPTWIDWGQDTITFKPGDDDTMFLEVDKVGIGTTSPDHTLHVKSGGTTHVKIESEAGYEAALKIKSGGQSSAYIWQPGSTSDLRFYINGADVMHLDNDGNVGIGTTGPDRKLDVLDAADPQLRLTHTDGSKYVDFYANGAGDLEITGSGTNAHLRFISPENATVVIQSQDTGDSDVSLAFSVDGGANVPFSIGVDDSDSDKFKIGGDTIDTDTKVTVTTGGKVGIATTSPESYLSLGGSVQFKVNSVSGDTTLDDTHHVVAADCNSGNVTVTLPTVSESILGRQYIIKRADTGGSGGGNSLTIARNGANIDGAGSDISGIDNGTSHTLICLGGAGWILVDKYVGI